MELNNLLTRFDRTPERQNNRNREVDHRFTAENATEPVTSSEQKTYSRVTVSADDTIVTGLIKAAREALEKFTGLSLITRTVQVQFNNPCGGYELPWGPITGAITMTDADDNAISNPITRGYDYITVLSPVGEGLQASYTAGFSTLPSDLKFAIMDQVDYMYEHRGSDAMADVCQKAIAACQRWSRKSVIA